MIHILINHRFTDRNWPMVGGGGVGWGMGYPSWSVGEELFGWGWMNMDPGGRLADIFGEENCLILKNNT